MADTVLRPELMRLLSELWKGAPRPRTLIIDKNLLELVSDGLVEIIITDCNDGQTITRQFTTSGELAIAAYKTRNV